MTYRIVNRIRIWANGSKKSSTLTTSNGGKMKTIPLEEAEDSLHQQIIDQCLQLPLLLPAIPLLLLLLLYTQQQRQDTLWS